MPADLRARLQRLRPQKTKRELVSELAPVPPSVPPEVVTQRREATLAQRQAAEIKAALPGREIRAAHGAYQLIEDRYPLDFTHGLLPLGAAFGHNPAIAAQVAREDALAQADLRALAFVDTETTGLAGGAGTLAFLVGVGVCEGDDFVLRQYFLRDPGEEDAMLAGLVNDLAERVGWVTFNGKAFDLPLLETRFTLNRRRGALGQRPHLDLLMPARRLYRGRLASCSLGSLEQNILRIIREQDDVPGELIPQLYQDYLRSGDARDMRRVIYHNAIDILSMVTLLAHVLEMFGENPKFQNPKPNLQAEDVLRLAQWHDDNGRITEAEVRYRQALTGKLPLEARAVGLERLAALLKRHNRRAEAAPLWEQWASFTLDDPTPFVELAKYYEWHARDYAVALQWADRAVNIVNAWPKNWQREEALEALERRRERVKSKK
jgi:hypothetical protein